MTTLWHFTCDHGYSGLGERGRLRPNKHTMLPGLGSLIWLTDDPAPDRDAVGLTSQFLTCDRMLYRYRVLTPGRCVKWTALRHRADPDTRQVLESYGEPETWWISFEPLVAVLDNEARERAA